MKKERCKESVMDSFHSHQCSRNEWMDGYCKQHYPASVEKRRKKSEERYKLKLKENPWYLFRQAKAEKEKLQNLVIEYFKHKDAFINDRTAELDEKLLLQKAFHNAEQALRKGIK